MFFLLLVETSGKDKNAAHTAATQAHDDEDSRGYPEGKVVQGGVAVVLSLGVVAVSVGGVVDEHTASDEAGKQENVDDGCNDINNDTDWIHFLGIHVMSFLVVLATPPADTEQIHGGTTTSGHDEVDGDHTFCWAVLQVESSHDDHGDGDGQYDSQQDGEGHG